MDDFPDIQELLNTNFFTLPARRLPTQPSTPTTPGAAARISVAPTIPSIAQLTAPVAPPSAIGQNPASAPIQAFENPPVGQIQPIPAPSLSAVPAAAAAPAQAQNPQQQLAFLIGDLLVAKTSVTPNPETGGNTFEWAFSDSKNNFSLTPPAPETAPNLTFIPPSENPPENPPELGSSATKKPDGWIVSTPNPAPAIEPPVAQIEPDWLANIPQITFPPTPAPAAAPTPAPAAAPTPAAQTPAPAAIPNLFPLEISRFSVEQTLDQGNANDAVPLIDKLFEQDYENYYEEDFTDQQVTVEYLKETLKTIKEETGKQAVIVYALVRLEALWLILVVPEGPPIIKKIPVNSQTLLKTVSEFHRFLAKPNDSADVRYLPIAQKLYQWLIAPIRSDIEALNIDIAVLKKVRIAHGALCPMPYALCPMPSRTSSF